MLHKLKFFAFLIFSAAGYLFLQIPLWEGYLQTANRHNLAWDSAVHFKEGYELYVQLTHLDFVSFFHRLLSLEYWLLTHPTLELVSLLISPHVESCVLLNYVVIALAYASVPLILCGTWSSRLIASTVLSLFFILMLQGNLFIGLHNTVMVESLSHALSILFLASTAKFFEEKEKMSHQLSCIFLMLIFMTKVHYGILLGAPFVLMSWNTLWDACPLFSKKELYNFSRKILSQPYFYTILIVCAFYSALILLQFSGRKELNIGGFSWSLVSYQTTTWPIFFAPLLIWTIEWWRGNNFIISKLSTEGRRLHHWVLFPFAWYYLIPGFQKICFLVGNIKVSRSENPLHTDWLQTLAHDYVSFPSEYAKFAVLGFVVLFTFFALLKSKKSSFSKAALYLGAQFFFYFIFITIVNKSPMTRLVSIWAAQLFIMLIWAILPLVKRARFSIALALILMCVVFGVRFEKYFSREKITNITRQEYLPINFLDSNTIFQCIDPTQPGILYGLGYDLAAPLFTVWVKQNDPRASLLFQSDFFLASDLGWGWKHLPLWNEFVLEKYRTGKYEQFVFFNIILREKELEEISKVITEESQGKIKVLIKNKHYVMLGNPTSLKPGCPIH